MGQKSIIRVGTAALLLAAILWAPIDSGSVARHTTDRLVRDGLSTLVGPQSTVAAPARLELMGSKPLHERLRTAARAPAMRDAQGVWQPAFEFVTDEQTPALTLSAERRDDRLVVTGGFQSRRFEKTARLADGWSLLPPLVALFIAIFFRSVIPALLLGVLAGASVFHGGDLIAMIWAEVSGLLGAFTFSEWAGRGYLSRVISDSFNLKILGFTFALVGMVSVVSRMGGARGLVNALSRFARGPKSAQAVTSLMGTALFFDDYANTVVVGTTARSMTDRFRLSREKLAYIVDSTSAPVAGVAIVSTWIGYEVGLFDDLLGVLNGVDGIPGSGYELFFVILPFRFYCFFALVLVFISAWQGRDFGAMYRAECRARLGGPLAPPSRNTDPTRSEVMEKTGVVPRAINAVVPVGSVLAFMFGWIFWAGFTDQSQPDLATLAGWKQIFVTAGDQVGDILIGASIFGSVIAISMAIGQGILTVKETAQSYFSGIRTLLHASAILILAWAIKAVCDDVGTGISIVALVGDNLSAIFLPFAIFALSGIVAFSTGTSWGTMALILPIAAPLAALISGQPWVVFASLAAVLDGAIWGDHCSPISDTTVLSSTATGCPHLAHVRTQLPYAILAMFVASVFGYLGVVNGLSLWLAYPLGIFSMAGALWFLGKAVPQNDDLNDDYCDGNGALAAEP